MDLTVTDVPEKSRYEARTGEQLAGFATYKLADRLVVFTHTEVEPQYEGQGVGGRLVQAALDDVRSRGLHVLPLCPFVKSWIQHHPDYADLVYGAPPSRVTD
jgi:predicted GNAT family acetyltransferase